MCSGGTCKARSRSGCRHNISPSWRFSRCNQWPTYRRRRRGLSIHYVDIWKPLNHLAAPPDAKWLSDSSRWLVRLQPVSVLSNDPINLFVTTNSDSSSMTQCDELCPPSYPPSLVQNSFLEACVFLFSHELIDFTRLDGENIVGAQI